MQSARSAAASAKETAANMAASAKAGMDKTKAVVQEKVEKISAHDPAKKDMATHKKEERIQQAEHNKQEVLDHNAAARHVAAGDGNQNISIAGARGPGAVASGPGAVASGQGHAGGFKTPDYLTGKDITGTEPKIPQNTNVEYPNTGTKYLAHNPNVGSNVGTGLNPGLDRSNVDAVYPADIGTGIQGNPNHNQAQYADGGAPIPGFGTGGLIE